MKYLRFVLFDLTASVILLFCCHNVVWAQVPPVSSPKKVGCSDANGRSVNCGDSWVVTYKGVVYDCTCNCSGSDDCTPRSQSGANDGQGGQNEDNSSDRQSEDNAAIEAERRRQNEELEKNEKERQEIFEKEQNNLINNLKGGGSTGTPGLKTSTTILPLKRSSNSSTLGLKTYDPSAENYESPSPRLRKELIESLSDNIHKRISEPSGQAREIIRSLKTNKPPSLFKNIDSLKAGDVILVAPIPLKDYKEAGIWNVGVSQVIGFADQWGSNRWNANASHTAIFLGVRNGKRWYLDNTREFGPVIKEEKQFLKEYGQRQMDIATYVGEPISAEQGKEIWKTAHELRNTKKYGILSDKKMVCSEASRWVLLSASRNVPLRPSENAKIFGYDTGLNKNDYVNFSPADFYENQQYFLVQRLSK